MCYMDIAMVFYPVTIGVLGILGYKILRKYKESKTKSTGTPTEIHQYDLLP